jgi:hypothetical protein
MKNLRYRTIRFLGLPTLVCAAWSVSAMAGGVAVSDGSELPSHDGCMLAFVYNQTNDHRLVVIDEKLRRRYEAPLENSRMAPFWEGGKIYVVAHSGTIQGFSIGADKLVPEKVETISAGVVRTSEYSRSQHRLYLIRTGYDNEHTVFYDLQAIDFPTRKTLWTKRIDDPGSLRIMDEYVCVTGLKLVQLFNRDTGKKIGTIEAATAADLKAQK